MEQEPDIQDEDAFLMLAAANGDEGAFEKLVLRHQKPLLNFFIRLGVYSDVEDLVQQTFVRLYKYRNRYKRRAKFTTFLYLLARQVRIDELRKRIRLQNLRERAKAHAELQADISPAKEATPALSDDLQTALNGLSEAHREVVILGMLQEMPYPEIAEVLHIPVGTVKSRMFHALRELRKLL